MGLTRSDRKWPLNDGPQPNPNGIPLAPGTGYHRVEENRRASRNGRVSDLPPEIPYVTIRNCKITVGGGGGAHPPQRGARARRAPAASPPAPPRASAVPLRPHHTTPHHTRPPVSSHVLDTRHTAAARCWVAARPAARREAPPRLAV
jgi:hypothetical protein